MPENATFELYVDPEENEIGYWTYWANVFDINLYSILNSEDNFYLTPVWENEKYQAVIQVDTPETVLAANPPSIIFGLLDNPNDERDIEVVVVNADNEVVGGGLVKLSTAIPNSKDGKKFDW